MKVGFNPEMFSGLSETAKNEKIHEVAAEFESFFMSQIFGSMMSSIPQSEFSGSGKEMEMFQSLFVDEISKQGSQSGKGLGLAPMIIKEMQNDASSQPLKTVEQKVDETF